VRVDRFSLARATVPYEMSHFSAVEAGSYSFGELCRCPVCTGLIGPWEASIVRSSGPQQIHWDLDVIVGRARSICGVVRLLSRGLLGVLLVRALVPGVWLHAAPELLERVLQAIIRDSSSSSYCFDHLSGFGVLDSLGLVLLVGLWKRWGDDCV
jgi:hypothetical protein